MRSDRGSRETPGLIAGRVFHFHLSEGSPPCNLHLPGPNRPAAPMAPPERQPPGTDKVRGKGMSPGGFGGFRRSQRPERDQGQAPRSWLAAAVRVMNTFLLPGMEILSCSPEKGNKLQPCLATSHGTLCTFSSSTHLSCKRNPPAHKGASIIFRDEPGSKSQ